MIEDEENARPHGGPRKRKGNEKRALEACVAVAGRELARLGFEPDPNAIGYWREPFGTKIRMRNAVKWVADSLLRDESVRKRFDDEVRGVMARVRVAAP